MSQNLKEWIQYIVCIVCILGAMVMSFLAMYIEPSGELHSSILWLIAQVLVFCGSIMGIDSLHNIQVQKIDKKIEDFIPTPNGDRGDKSVRSNN